MVRERLTQLSPQLAADLAHATLRDADPLADLAQRHVLDVQQEEDLAVARTEPAEHLAEAGLRVRPGHGAFLQAGQQCRHSRGTAELAEGARGRGPDLRVAVP